MESETRATPLKVCPHCSVARRTEAAECPSCGRSYTRRRPRLPGWRWWMLVPVALVAFGAAYGITELVQGGGGGSAQPAPPPGITFQQGRTIKIGIGQRQLAGQLGVPPLRVVRRHVHPPQVCRYYLITDQPGEQWAFCFLKGKLVTSAAGPAR